MTLNLFKLVAASFLIGTTVGNTFADQDFPRKGASYEVVVPPSSPLKIRVLEKGTNQWYLVEVEARSHPVITRPDTTSSSTILSEKANIILEKKWINFAVLISAKEIILPENTAIQKDRP